jgi:hypothetical protein
MKKKYNLPIGAGSARKAVDSADGAEPKVPITPSKNRVAKTTRGRAIPSKKSKQANYVSDESDGNESKAGKNHKATMEDDHEGEEDNVDAMEDESSDLSEHYMDSETLKVEEGETEV